ncbi:MAG: TIGR01906 family membrane protein [Tissierellia bacterium]|nr:TIGR01906 family membrane protein [Tissierellia bacterium]
MKNKNIWHGLIYHIWSILLAIALLFASLTLSISLNSKDMNYYHDYQVENQIDLRTGKKQDELDIISRDLINYLDMGQDDLLTRHFNEREIAHMRDVFGLYELNRKITDVSLTIIIVSLFINIIFKNKDMVTKKTAYYLIALISVAILFAILASGNFNKYFVAFHELFFDNDLWLLDPKTDLMIQMLPLGFFIGMAKNIFIYFALAIFLVLLILLFDVYFNKKSKGCVLCNLKVVG